VSDQAIKKAFVKEILIDEGKRYIKNQGLAMRRLLLFHTNQSFSRRKYVVGDTNNDSFDGKLSITQQINVRFLDIKKKGINRFNGRRAKNYPIYNKFAYGHYYSIAERLMFELTDDVRLRIRNELKGNTNG